jgi:hypothetical protein
MIMMIMIMITMMMITMMMLSNDEQNHTVDGSNSSINGIKYMDLYAEDIIIMMMGY